MITSARNPRQEAVDCLRNIGEPGVPTVLEPSPPAVNAPPWFADDPAVPGDVDEGTPVVTPTTAGTRTWDDVARDHPEIAGWCAERWLGAWPRIGPRPPGLATTREALHRLAEHVLAPARHAATGKIGLRWTLGGFGTPFYADDRQLRVDGDELVVVTEGEERRAPVTTLRAAAHLAGVDLGAGTGVYEPSTSASPDAALRVDGEAMAFLSAWFGFTTSVLEQLRAEAAAADEPSRVQLWPEHFDVAVELGSEATGTRASYGASPGDAEHGDPYLYVAPWSRPSDDPFWNDPAFGGASLRHGALVASPMPRSAALMFFREARQRLARTARWQPPSG